MTKVLVVEDERILAWALQRMLEGRGYVVVGCSDTGQGALGMAQDRQSDIDKPFCRGDVITAIESVLGQRC